MDVGKLIDREHEQGLLAAAWDHASRGQPQLAVVWGRRRVGKTYLLTHFARDKRTVFFGATQQAEGVELGRLAEAVRKDLGDRVADLLGSRFATWEAALRALAALATDEPLLVVIDEVPYLADSTPGFASIVQAIWDHLRPRTKLLLVLTGSSIGVIEQMLGARGALLGRPTVALRMDPLRPVQARAFLPRLEAAAFVEAYAACGGYPLHLVAWDSRGSTHENLVRMAGTAGGLLIEDAMGILRAELPAATGYPRILAAIGRGRAKYSEIANDAGQRVEHPLDVLVHAGFVRKEVPIGAPRAARPIYVIDDVYLAFWFGVLYADLTLVERGQGKTVLRRAEPRWQAHLGWVFEELARAHAVRLVERGELPDDLVVGRWWAQTGQQCEVDVLGLRGNRTALIGEARWQKTPMDMRDLHAVQRKLSRVPNPEDEPVVALWGRAGASKEVRRAGARTFDLDDMLAG